MVEQGDQKSYEIEKAIHKKWLKDPTPQNKEQYHTARDAFVIDVVFFIYIYICIHSCTNVMLYCIYTGS